ncbi:hypothetical protein ACFSCZ_18385 [Siminovitchia sediminis]|uniref:Uncharacterized protein n=1 Tax=Siminovitchia sediminis TaxID=1274353 RepID=A0ABW4KKH8_9BACI
MWTAEPKMAKEILAIFWFRDRIGIKAGRNGAFTGFVSSACRPWAAALRFSFVQLQAAGARGRFNKTMKANYAFTGFVSSACRPWAAALRFSFVQLQAAGA